LAPVLGADGGEVGPFGLGGGAGFATQLRAKEVESQEQDVEGPTGGSKSRKDDGQQDESDDEGEADDVCEGRSGDLAERVDFSFGPALVGNAGLETGSGAKRDEAACDEQE